jgi:hypothetical protein
MAQRFGIVGTWVISRLWVFVLLWLLPYIPYDIQLYEIWSDQLLAGAFPSNDSMWQYPDGVAYILLLPQLSPIGYLPSFVYLALVIDFIALLILYRWQRTTQGSMWGLWLWATAGFWIGPTLLTRLDVFVALTAILALVSQRTWLQALFAGFGFSLKLWPILLAFNAGRRKLLPWALVFTATVLGIFTLARLLFPGGDSFLFNQSNRGLHGETVAALPYLLMPDLFNSSGLVEQNGTLEVTGAGTAQVGFVMTLLGLIAVAILFLLQFRDRLPNVLPTDLVFIALLITIVFGRVFSTQFYVWLAAVGAVTLTLRSSQSRGPMLLIVASAMTAQYIYPFRMGWADLESDAVAAQALRIALICAALIWALFNIRGNARNTFPAQGRLGQ